MALQVQYFGVQVKKPKNKYPWHRLKRIGDGFIIPKKDLPKGSLNGLARHLGWVLQISTLEDGSKKVVLKGRGVRRSPVAGV